MIHRRGWKWTLSIAGVLLIASHRIAVAQDPSSADPWRLFVAEAAKRFGVSDALIRAVMHAESGGDTRPDRSAVTSPAGAIGLMQVMPETYAELRARYGFGSDPFDPHDNILAGAAYLHEMELRFGKRYFLAAYQAGPRRVDDYLSRGILLPTSTFEYVTNVQRKLGFGDASFESPAVVSTSVAESLFVRSNRPWPVFQARAATATSASILVPLQRLDRRRIGVEDARESSINQLRE